MANAWGNSFGLAWGVSWGSGSPPPTPAQKRDGGGGFPGHVVFYTRPPELKPKRAKAKVLRKLTKRLKVTPVQAEYLFDWADSVTAGLMGVHNWRDLAFDTSSRKLTAPEIKAVESYWDIVLKAAIEVAEDDELMLLLF